MEGDGLVEARVTLNQTTKLRLDNSRDPSNNASRGFQWLLMVPLTFSFMFQEVCGKLPADAHIYVGTGHFPQRSFGSGLAAGEWLLLAYHVGVGTLDLMLGNATQTTPPIRVTEVSRTLGVRPILLPGTVRDEPGSFRVEFETNVTGGPGALFLGGFAVGGPGLHAGKSHHTELTSDDKPCVEASATPTYVGNQHRAALGAALGSGSTVGWTGRMEAWANTDPSVYIRIEGHLVGPRQ